MSSPRSSTSTSGKMPSASSNTTKTHRRRSRSRQPLGATSRPASMTAPLLVCAGQEIAWFSTWTVTLDPPFQTVQSQAAPRVPVPVQAPVPARQNHRKPAPTRQHAPRRPSPDVLGPIHGRTRTTNDQTKEVYGAQAQSQTTDSNSKPPVTADEGAKRVSDLAEDVRGLQIEETRQKRDRGARSRAAERSRAHLDGETFQYSEARGHPGVQPPRNDRSQQEDRSRQKISPHGDEPRELAHRHCEKQSVKAPASEPQQTPRPPPIQCARPPPDQPQTWKSLLFKGGYSLKTPTRRSSAQQRLMTSTTYEEWFESLPRKCQNGPASARRLQLTEKDAKVAEEIEELVLSMLDGENNLDELD